MSASLPRPPAYAGVVTHRHTNGFAIAALVLGIVWVWWIGSILALIFGHVALWQIDGDPDHQSGRGLAIAGVVLGWVGVGTLLLTIVVLSWG
jgi:hypothetical protein